jgi:hypothetical protein
MILRPKPLRERLADSRGRPLFGGPARQRGFISTLQQGQFGRSVAGTGGGDLYWPNVVIYLDFDVGSTNGGNAITDRSTSAHTMTVHGGATTTNVDSAYGTTLCGVFDGTGDNWTTPDNSDFSFSNQPFTIEGTAYTTVNNEFNFLWSTRNVSGGDAGVFIGMTSGGKLFAAANNASTAVFSLTGGTTIPTNTQFEWAFSRVGDTGYLLLNGAVETSAGAGGDKTIDNQLTSSLWIGSSSNEDGTRDWKGRMYRNRVTKGVGRYSGTYTPAAWPVGA